MKILHVITRADLGGAQRHLLDLLSGLRADFNVEAAMGEEGYFSDSVRELGLPVHIVPSLVQPLSVTKDARALFELIQLIRRRKPDLVHAHTSKAGVIGRAAARLTGTPSIFTAHTWCFAEGTSLKWKLLGTPAEKVAARCCRFIINVSAANRELALRNGIAPADKLVTIHNGVPDEPHRAQPCGGGPVRIVMVARFVQQKAQDDLLRALSGINAALEVVFAGDGPLRSQAEALAGQLRIADRVHFLGERRDIAELLASAHIFALPTHWEGFPLSVLEAMRAGLPVVASDVGGIREAVVTGETGLLVRPESVEEFRGALMQLIEQPALRGQMGAAGRARFERNFTFSAMCAKTVAIYNAVLQQKHTLQFAGPLAFARGPEVRSKSRP